LRSSKTRDLHSKSQTNKGEEEDEDESFEGASDFENGLDGDDAYQGNEMAFKSVDIDEQLMAQELASLRELSWRILERV
jgi:hypothetical protein